MRINHALFVLLFTVPLTAQEAPLPVVTPRTANPDVLLIATAVEPIRTFHGPSLAEAARNNDFATFDALYREARQRGEAVAQFETLHQLWTYNVTDRVGAFYGQEMYERLARAYPGYARFIDDHRIVDSYGNVFYPTSETREFVLERALEGRVARVLVAASEEPSTTTFVAEAEQTPTRVATAERRTRTDAGTAPAATRTAPAAQRSRTRTASATVAEAAPRPKATRVETPAAAPAAKPVAVATQTHSTAAVEAPVASEAPVADAAPAVATPVNTTPVNTTPVAAAPVQTEAVAPVSRKASAEGSAASRGILLIVIGLLGVGLLAVMFRAPQESLRPIIDVKATDAPADDAKPAAPVEPLRRPEERPQHARKNRATGSRR